MLMRESRLGKLTFLHPIEMGHKLSKAVFIRDLKASLRERGVRVKKKDLINFFIFIDQACSWFIIDGAEIHHKKWRRVGRKLNIGQAGPLLGTHS